MTKDTNLLPCPGCEGTTDLHVEDMSGAGGVICANCGMSGPTAEGRKNIIAAWNALPRFCPSGLALEWRADETGIIVFAYIGKHCCIGDVTEDFDGGWHAALWSMDAPDGREELVGPKQGLWDTEAEARAALEARARSALGVEDGE